MRGTLVQFDLFNMTGLGNEKPSYYRHVTYSIIWQIGPLCHNNEALHENSHKIFCHMQNKYTFKCLYKYANFFHDIYVDLKEKSIVY